MATQINKRIGVSQARKEFSALIEAVATGAGAVEIIDNGKVAAVLISEHEYIWLSACGENSRNPKRCAQGLIVITGENSLEEAVKLVQLNFDESINETASEL